MNLRDYLMVGAVFILIILGWDLAIRAFNIPAYILPTPASVAATAVEERDQIAYHTLVTVKESFLGLCLGSLMGFILAVMLSQSETIRKSIYPYIIAVKTAPIIAVAPLLIIWFGSGLAAKVLTIALMTFFSVVVNTVKGLTTAGENELEFFKLLGASRIQVFMKYRLPNALPYIFTGLKIASTVSVLGAVAVELIGADEGLGFLIIIASYYLKIDVMFVALGAVALVGMGFFGLVCFLEKKIVFWQVWGKE